jgi:hypothetical protein
MYASTAALYAAFAFWYSVSGFAVADGDADGAGVSAATAVPVPASKPAATSRATLRELTKFAFMVISLIIGAESG